MPFGGYSGGQIDRFVHESMLDLVEDILRDRNWFDVIDGWTPVTVGGEPAGKDEVIPPNHVTVTVLDSNETNWELGSTFAELTYTFYVDINAETRDDGTHIRGDLVHALAGRDPAIGRAAPTLVVYAYDTPTPAELFVAELTHVEGTADPTPQTPWQQRAYTVTGFIVADWDGSA